MYFEYFLHNPAEDWDLAFAHAEMSYAAAVSGDLGLHREHYEMAAKFGEGISNEEERKVFLEEFEKIPAP